MVGVCGGRDVGVVDGELMPRLAYLVGLGQTALDLVGGCSFAALGVKDVIEGYKE